MGGYWMKVSYAVKTVGKSIYVYKTESHRLGPFKTKDEAMRMVEILKTNENPLEDQKWDARNEKRSS